METQGSSAQGSFGKARGATPDPKLWGSLDLSIRHHADLNQTMCSTFLSVADINRVLADAMIHRVKQADPGAPESITISRTAFDQLIAVGEFASRVHVSLLGSSPTLTVKRDGDRFRATLVQEGLASAESSGSSLLEAIVEVNRAFNRQIERTIE